MIALDFETYPIVNDGPTPPDPLGLAVHGPGGSSYADQGPKTLWTFHQKDEPIFHNAKFDLSVALNQGWALPDQYHDTMILGFLLDPYSDELGLKQLAERYLHILPSQRDKLKEWILSNELSATEKNYMNFLSTAPANLVGKYAMADVKMTAKLFQYMAAKVKKEGMWSAYKRELNLLPIVIGMERQGVRVDVPRLEKDMVKWERQVKKFDKQIYKILGSTFNIDSSAQLADALDKAGVVHEWIMTDPTGAHPDGQRSVAEPALRKILLDESDLLDLILTRSKLKTFINTFAKKWLDIAGRYSGKIYPKFNTTKQDYDAGARTGRFSSAHPNLQNVPRNQTDKRLPNMRDYLLPPDGCIWVAGDFNQQEVRMLGHFVEGHLQQRFTDPTFSIHKDTHAFLLKNSVDIDYYDTKTTVFSIIYGSGVTGVSNKLGVTKEKAKLIRDTIFDALPQLKTAMDKMREYEHFNIPIITWGGRKYYCEKGKSYKMLNYLIQGSCADVTKEAMIRVASAPDYTINLQIHDELLGFCEKGKEAQAVKQLKDAMESIETDVPMTATIKTGNNWGGMNEWK